MTNPFSFTSIPPMDYPTANEARSLARMAHRGQVDKAGDPYIEHVDRVANRAYRRVWGDQYLHRYTTTNMDMASKVLQVGLLHDIVEDTFVTLRLLAQFGFPYDIIEGVASVTKGQALARELGRAPGLDLGIVHDAITYAQTNTPDYLGSETYDAFARRASRHWLGRWIKWADLKDHLRDPLATVDNDGNGPSYELPPAMRQRYERALEYFDNIEHPKKPEEAK